MCVSVSLVACVQSCTDRLLSLTADDRTVVSASLQQLLVEKLVELQELKQRDDILLWFIQ